MQLLDELAVKRGGYDPNMLKDIHRATVDRIVMPEKIGVFRTTEVVIKEEGTGKVIFQPPPSHEVPYLLEDFFEWLNDPVACEIHPIIRQELLIIFLWRSIHLWREMVER